MNISMDSDTGLPQLPKGHIWRVTQHRDNSGVYWKISIVYIQIQEEYSWWRAPKESRHEWVRHTWCITDVKDGPLSRELTSELLVDSAIDAYSQCFGIEPLHPLVGDYPPKVVN